MSTALEKYFSIQNSAQHSWGVLWSTSETRGMFYNFHRCGAFYGALLIASTWSSSAFTTRVTETLLVRGLLGRLFCCGFAAVIRKPKVKRIQQRRVRSALLIEILFRCLWGALMMMPRCVSLFALCGRKMKWSKLCVCSRNSARASIQSLWVCLHFSGAKVCVFFSSLKVNLFMVPFDDAFVERLRWNSLVSHFQWISFSLKFALHLRWWRSKRRFMLMTTRVVVSLTSV